MAENKTDAQQKADNNAVDIKKLLEEQAKQFETQLKAQAEQNKQQLDALMERNNKLAEELTNLKTNTAEENALLGEKINAIGKGEDLTPKYNPFKEGILYNVHNEVAGIDTVMTGDEVKGIIGSIDKHLKVKLINGEKKIEKYPYTITLIEEEKAEVTEEK